MKMLELFSFFFFLVRVYCATENVCKSYTKTQALHKQKQLYKQNIRLLQMNICKRKILCYLLARSFLLLFYFCERFVFVVETLKLLQSQ